MEQKLVRVPFNVELAREITNKEIEGRIVTTDGRNARIVCWDAKNELGQPMIVLIDSGDYELIDTYRLDGNYNNALSFEKAKLMLEIPEYLTFKGGDILIGNNGKPFIYNGKIGRHGSFGTYCGIHSKEGVVFDIEDWTAQIKCRADETQRLYLIDELKRCRNPKAKEYLRCFFRIEQKSECEFKPFDKVLVRNSEEMEWIPRFFERIANCSESVRYITMDGNSWKYCIPYNEETAHLLRADDDWEG